MTTRLIAALTLGVSLLGSAPAAAHERFRFVGTLEKVDTKAKLLTVKLTPSADKSLPPDVDIGLTPKTRIERDGKPVAVSQLKPGLYVVVDALGDAVFDTDAVTVRIVPAPKKPPQVPAGRQ